MEMIPLSTQLKLPLPEGFHVLDEEEKSRLHFLEEGPCLCISDPERHILVAFGWKKAGGLAGLLLNTGDIAKNTEKTARRAMQNLGYRCLGFGKRQIAGTDADGFRYTYTAQDTEMLAESYAAKMDKEIFYFHFYARAAGEAESLSIWDALLQSVQRSG